VAMSATGRHACVAMGAWLCRMARLVPAVMLRMTPGPGSLTGQRTPGAAYAHAVGAGLAWSCPFRWGFLVAPASTTTGRT